MQIPFHRQRSRAVEVKPDELDLLDPDLWDDISDDIQSELLRQAEIMVRGTVTISLGADQRAATAMNVFGAGAIALLVAAAALIASNKLELLLICAPAVAALGLFVAAGLCASAIAPVRFLLPGARPQSIFCTDVAHHRRLRAALIHSAERAISHNMTRMIRSAEWFELALFIAGAGVLAGVGFIALWVAYRGGRPF